MGVYSEHTYITAWNVESGGTIEAEKYESGTFGTVNIEKIKQLCNEIYDESAKEPKDLTKEEIIALGKTYQSVFPELQKQEEDYKKGYKCSKVYVNKMEA